VQRETKQAEEIVGRRQGALAGPLSAPCCRSRVPRTACRLLRVLFSAAHRSKSASQATSFIDSDSYVVVGMGESQDAAGLDSPPPPRDTASSGTDSRAALGRELARDSSD
jgi:hypothetical protein